MVGSVGELVSTEEGGRRVEYLSDKVVRKHAINYLHKINVIHLSWYPNTYILFE